MMCYFYVARVYSVLVFLYMLMCYVCVYSPCNVCVYGYVCHVCFCVCVLCV